MRSVHQPDCRPGNAVNAPVRPYGAVSTIAVTTHPWLGTAMAFATKGQRLKEHPG